jgi:hypothetical protein
MNGNNKIENLEHRLPKSILDKAIKSTNEFGWKQEDFVNVVEAAKENQMAVIGGQVQYIMPNATCELYWLSYDSENRKQNEDWNCYCNRSANECIEKFNKLISSVNIEKEAVESFEFLAHQKNKNVNLSEHLAFMLYFDDTETDSFL